MMAKIIGAMMATLGIAVAVHASILAAKNCLITLQHCSKQMVLTKFFLKSSNNYL